MRTLILVTTLFSALILAPAARATTFYERPFEETVQDVPNIVRGTIGNTYPDWGKASDGTKRIYTFIEVSVSEVLKGQIDSRTLIMREMGGEKDGVGLQVAGAAHFDRGEDVVVFLTPKNPDGTYDLRGMSTGKLNIERDENGQEVLVGGAIPGMGGHGHEGHGHENATGGQPDSKWTLGALRKLIQEQGKAQTVEKNQKNPAAVPTPTATSGAEKAQETPAPQLQPSSTREAEATSSGFPAWAGLVLGGLGALLLLGWVGRSFRRR